MKDLFKDYLERDEVKQPTHTNDDNQQIDSTMKQDELVKEPQEGLQKEDDKDQGKVSPSQNADSNQASVLFNEKVKSKMEKDAKEKL